MPHRDVPLLHVRRRVVGRHQRDVAHRGELAALRARHADRRHAQRLRGAYRPAHALGAAARRDRDQYVARRAEPLQLAREHLVVAVVVADRRDRGAVHAERHGRQPRAVHQVAARELGRQVLRVGGAAAVAAEVHGAAALEALHEHFGRRGDRARALLLDALQRAARFAQGGARGALERSRCCTTLRHRWPPRDQAALASDRCRRSASRQCGSGDPVTAAKRDESRTE